MNDVAVFVVVGWCDDDLNPSCCRLETRVSCADDLTNSSCCRLETIVSCADDLNRGVVLYLVLLP